MQQLALLCHSTNVHVFRVDIPVLLMVFVDFSLTSVFDITSKGASRAQIQCTGTNSVRIAACCRRRLTQESGQGRLFFQFNPAHSKLRPGFSSFSPASHEWERETRWHARRSEREKRLGKWGLIALLRSSRPGAEKTAKVDCWRVRDTAHSTLACHPSQLGGILYECIP